MTALNEQNELLAEARREMRQLGIEHAPRRWVELALILLRDRRLLIGTAKPGEETVEISKTLHELLLMFTGAATHLVADLRRLDKNYAALEKPGQLDALNHAIDALEAIDRHLDGFGVSRLGGLPVPLVLVLKDLVNAKQRVQGDLVTPPAGSKPLRDNPKERARLTIQAYSADMVRRLLKQAGGRGKRKAAEEVAKVLDRCGFWAPGRRTSLPKERTTRAYDPRTIEEWFTKAEAGTAPFTAEYRQAGEAVEDVSPDTLLKEFENTVRSSIVHRD